jgi:hypothetical protein
MYIYIYDSFVNQKKNDKILARIETRITDLGLSGKIIRIGITTSVHDTIDSEIRKGANTIIVVGNNDIFSQALNSITKLSPDGKIILGLIPVGKDKNEIADLLGIDLEEKACDVLSARRIKSLNLGKANNNYFLTEAKITTEHTKLEIDENYIIESHEPGDVIVDNLTNDEDISEKHSKNVGNNNLQLFIKTKQLKKFSPLKTARNSQSYFAFNTLNIINAKHFLILDGCLRVETPVKISTGKEKINLIVGKNRTL